MPVKRKGIVNTKRGITHYYTVLGVYNKKLTFFVRFDYEDPKMESEHEFSVPETEYSVEQLETFVLLFSHAFDMGRHKGRWEKARRFDELVALFKREGLGT